MSEFKYACPVCGQHIKCDSSQTGTVMDCPTCFQKITVPQAPAGDDQKFILTGSQVSEKPVAPPLIDRPAVVETGNKISGVLGVALILIFMGVTAAAIYWVTIIRPHHQPAQTISAKPKPPVKPAVVAPPANETNWMLAPGTNAIPDSAAAGRIHGVDFIVEQASFQNGLLQLRQGTRGPVEFGFSINFNGAQPEDLAGKTINVTTNTEKAAQVALHWKEDGSGKVKRAAYDAGYALRLTFGTLAKDRLPGEIYLCTPDAEKSYLLGSFNANARKPKPKPAGQ